ncbi:hypothetical protein GURASL_13970 [Geotalea uraniireducens]|uniref:DUF503 domain-containing protein n=2 Tax=Geotalea uraniireducens TaxID=351604 RepID=A0ABN6VQ67_9BACT|nr:hypothetical protein GURASL_13970 [Geotalea uraniireducens]
MWCRSPVPPVTPSSDQPRPAGDVEWLPVAAVLFRRPTGMFVFSLAVHIYLPSHSLKGKRGIVKSILARARQNFNVAAVEADLHDRHGETLLGFVTVSPSRLAGRQALERLEEWLVAERPDVDVVATDIEER